MSKQEIRYGLSKKDFSNAKKKLKKQEDYLESNNFTTTNGEIKTFLDVSFSANLSERYYPRMLNKIDTFTTLALDQGLVPIFLTITLDGFFRDFLKGDFTRFTQEKREQYLKHIPNNERSGFYMDYIDSKQILTPKDLYKILGHQIHRFNMSKSLKAIRKDGLQYSYIRVTEPHKDGVPHFHILMYAPKEYLPSIYEDFKRFFPAPQNHKKLSRKYHKREANEIGANQFETVGFQTEIKNASAYILKYILKSFTNLINNEELDYLQAWYIQNKIPRIITTRTLVSQYVYTKIAPLDNDWYALTNIKLEDIYTADVDNDYFRLDDTRGRVITIDKGYVTITRKGNIVASYGEKKQNTLKKLRLRGLSFTVEKPINFNLLFMYEIWKPPKDYSYYINTNFKDGTLFSFGNFQDFSVTHVYELGICIDEHGEFQGFADIFSFDTQQYMGVTPISKLLDYEAFSQYQSFDFDKYVPGRYAILKNELIDRGIIRELKVNPNDFNTSFYD